VRLSFDPAVILLLLGAGALYARAVAVLRERGVAVSRWQQAAWWAGLGLTAAALLGPFDRYGEDLMSAHMAQHLLVADLAAPLLLVGLRTPVLFFYLPRPVLVPLARATRLRRLLRAWRRPLPAVATYVAVLYTWHIPVLFEGALGNDLLHALQHESFVLAALLVWWPALEPKRRRLRGELWKAAHIVGARFSGMFLGMFFIIASTPIYAGWYGEGERELGLSPLTDQQIAGASMIFLDAITMLFAIAFFFFRSAQDHDIAEAAERERAAVHS
jgi:cytochrome c oxidase assembly factor CtaG